MLKAVGVFLILIGTFLGLVQWEMRRKRRIRRLCDIGIFFKRAGFALEKEQRTLISLFDEYGASLASKNQAADKGSEDLLSECLHGISCELSKNYYQDGLSAWKKVMEEHKGEWDFNEEEWQCLLESGQGFFGRDRRQLAQRLETDSRRMNAFAEQEKKGFQEQKKVVFPVGLLGAATLLVLLS